MHGKSLSGVVERNYQFQRQLYRYVEAELWEATHLTQHNTYWILAFDSYLSEKPERYNVLRRSMESFAPLQHPHLLGISEFWEGAGGRLFVALSHLPNAMPLYELRGQLAPGEIQFIFSELVALIEWTHDWGIVLDLRPDQIFLRQRPFAFRYLLLPKQDSIAVLRTQPDIARVDSRYLSPEEVEGWPQTKASAYFTLGTILFETLTGQDAFLADTALSTLEMIRSGRSPAIEQAALDPGMRSLLEHLMQPNPEYRLKDSQIVREHIQSVLGRGAAWSPQGSADASLVAVPKVEEDMFDDHTAISDGEGFGGASHASVDWLSPPL